MAFTDGVGGKSQVGDLRLQNLGLQPGDPSSAGGLSTKELLEKLVKMMQGQQDPQAAQGGQQGGPQAAGGAKGAQNGGGDNQFSLEELLKELQKRAQLNQDEMANQLRQVSRTAQTQGSNTQQPTQAGITQQLLAAAPATLDVGNMGLTIPSGGGGMSGGSFA